MKFFLIAVALHNGAFDLQMLPHAFDSRSSCYDAAKHMSAPALCANQLQMQQALRLVQPTQGGQAQ